MIRPTDAELLAGVAKALKTSVLPELARGTAARKQLQAAIEILRRVAFALPNATASLAADNEDMTRVLLRASDILDGTAASPSPRPSPIEEEEGSDADRNLHLQSKLNALQDRLPTLPTERRAQIDTLLAALFGRMTDRALALIPPPAPRTPGSAP